jgi:Holliday junction resolvase RusA-like endonuclease
MKIVIPGDPIPKARHRTFVRNGRSQTYDPQHREKNHTHDLFVLAVREAMSDENEEIALEASNLAKARKFHLSVTFYMWLNVSDSETAKNAKLWGFDPCNKKPDCSNMLKFYEDAANEVLYPDDSMIVSGDFKKVFDTNPRTEINIMTLDELFLVPHAEAIIKLFSPETLTEFLDDVKRFDTICAREVVEAESVDRRDGLLGAALLLETFAEKYGDTFQKIKKINRQYASAT